MKLFFFPATILIYTILSAQNIYYTPENEYVGFYTSRNPLCYESCGCELIIGVGAKGYTGLFHKSFEDGFFSRVIDLEIQDSKISFIVMNKYNPNKKTWTISNNMVFSDDSNETLRKEDENIFREVIYSSLDYDKISNKWSGAEIRLKLFEDRERVDDCTFQYADEYISDIYCIKIKRYKSNVPKMIKIGDFDDINTNYDGELSFALHDSFFGGEFNGLIRKGTLSGKYTKYDGKEINVNAQLTNSIWERKYRSESLKIIDAVKNAQNDKLHDLLRKHYNVNVKDENGNTPLMWSSYNNNKKITELLIKNGAYVSGIYDKNGWNALMGAIFKNNTEIALLLLEYSDNWHICRPTVEGYTALSLAKGKGNKVLIEKIDKLVEYWKTRGP